ncbi:MAG: hypothetical protein AAGF11_32925 [Myxococcota bacterium]
MNSGPLSRLQDQILGGTALILVGMRNVKEVKRSIRSRLLRGFREGVLKADYTNLVWHKKQWFPEYEQELIAVLGGVEINRQRDPSLPHFERVDGSWFDFHIHLRPYDGEHSEHRGALELFGYGYEIRFPTKLGLDLPWLRFDLNHPRHDNEFRAVRAHFHPGDEDLQAPSPVLHPDQALELLLSKLLQRPSKRRPRATTT